MARVEFKSERHHALENRYPSQGFARVGRTWTQPPRTRRTDPRWWQRLTRAIVRWL